LNHTNSKKKNDNLFFFVFEKKQIMKLSQMTWQIKTKTKTKK